MSRLFRILAPAAALFISACTLDNLVVLKHPVSAGKGETFAVGAMDIIADVNPASRTPDSIFRDSIHFAVGLPSGWEVLSVKACPAPHFRPLRASVNGLDTNFRNKLLLDTLGACESRAVALVEDPGIKLYLKGRTIKANASPDSLGKSFTVKTDTVPQWFGYGGRIDVSVPAGQPADTVLDTTALKALPVFIYLSLKAATIDTSVRLLYFSRTGRLDTAAFSNTSNPDRGALVYRPMIVGSPVSVRLRADPAASGVLSIAQTALGARTIRLPAPASSGIPVPWRSLEIRGSSGAALRTWSGSSLSGREAVAWDGRDAAGGPLPAGRYVLVLTGWQGVLAKAFPLLP